MRDLHGTYALLAKTLNFELIVYLLRVACTCTQQRQSGSKRAFKPRSSNTFGMSGCSWEPCVKAMEQALKSLEPSQQEIRHAFELASRPFVSCGSTSGGGGKPDRSFRLLRPGKNKREVDGCLQEVDVCDRGLGATRLGTRLRTRTWTRLQDAPGRA